jgi:hypothetical protein
VGDYLADRKWLTPSALAGIPSVDTMATMVAPKTFLFKKQEQVPTLIDASGCAGESRSAPNQLRR